MGEFQALFPAVVAAMPLGMEKDTRNRIANYIRKNKDKFKKRGRDGVVFEESLINFHHIAMMEPMFQKIAKAVREALKGMGIDPQNMKLQITRSWANYNVKSSVTALHTHINSHVNIVY